MLSGKEITSLPPLEDLPQEIAENLTTLETLDDQALWEVMAETVPADQSNRIHELLEQQQEKTLNEAERIQLEDLQRCADSVMLRKARAAVLLRFRGRRVPTVAELEHLSCEVE